MTENDMIVPGFDERKCEHVEMKLQKINTVVDCLVIHLNGYINSYNSLSFQKKIEKVIEAGFTKLIFNCKRLTYISSTGIGSFTVLLQHIKKKGGDIVLMNIPSKVQDIFKLLGFFNFFQTARDLDEACRLFPGKKDLNKESVFPKIFDCPGCSKRLKAPKSGRFRCAECKGIIVLDDNGKVSLG